MLKKLTSLSLSVLACLTLLPNQANAMEASGNEPPVQMEYMEDWDSFGNADAGIAPCRESIYDDSSTAGGGGSNGCPIDCCGNGKPRN